MKICSKCKKEKDLSEFSKNKTKKDGFDLWCKECHQKKDKDYFENLDDEQKTIRNQRSKDWCKNNKNHLSEYQKQYREKNKEQINYKRRLKKAQKAGFKTIEEFKEYNKKQLEIKKSNKKTELQKEKELKKQEKIDQSIKNDYNKINNIKYDIVNDCHIPFKQKTIIKRADNYWSISLGKYYNNKLFAGKKNYLHRVIFAIKNPGTDIENKVIMHTCDNPSCINPKHLILGTKQDNTQDMLDKDRACKNNPRKLTDKQIIEIYLSSKSSYELEKEYDVTAIHIRRIRNGSRCARITGHK